MCLPFSPLCKIIRNIRKCLDEVCLWAWCEAEFSPYLHHHNSRNSPPIIRCGKALAPCSPHHSRSVSCPYHFPIHVPNPTLITTRCSSRGPRPSADWASPSHLPPLQPSNGPLASLWGPGTLVVLQVCSCQYRMICYPRTLLHLACPPTSFSSLPGPTPPPPQSPTLVGPSALCFTDA